MSFSVHADTWLAEVMRRQVFRVQGSGDVAAIAEHATGQRRAFYFAKVAVDRIADVQALGTLGFSVVDTNVTFELTHELPESTLDVSEIKPGEEDAVLAIAGSAFRYSRFHLDPQVGLDLAHLVKREWIANYVKRVRGEPLLVVREPGRDAGRPIGFLAPIIAHETAVIDLVAVATDAHGKGAGSALCAAFANRYRGMPRIVGTQVANVPSVRLYTKLGFTLSKSSYVLHLHHGAAS